jgi:hypothetical protein
MSCGKSQNDKGDSSSDGVERDVKAVFVSFGSRCECRRA